MKIIDERGRIFGKINVIDFSVILFLLALTPMFYFGNRIMAKKPIVQNLFEEDVQINCQLIRLSPDIAKIISTGDKEIDDKKRVIGEIVELGASEPYKGDPMLKQRWARLELKAKPKGGELYYKDKIIDYDSELIFGTDKYNATVKVKEDITKIINVNITLKDLNRDTLNLISVGDREVNAAGKTIAEIVGIGQQEDDYLELNLGGGNFIKSRGFDKKQLTVEMKLRCRIINEGNRLTEISFKGEELKYVMPIEFVTDKYRVKGYVSEPSVKIEAKKSKWISLRVKFFQVLPEIADIIQAGDIERDSDSAIVARIGKVLRDDPVKTVVAQEKKLAMLASSQRNLEVLLDVFCEISEGGYHFKGGGLKMGNSISFSTELYNITGTIIGIEAK